MAPRAGDERMNRTTRRARFALPTALAALVATGFSAASLGAGCGSGPTNDAACSLGSEGCPCDTEGVAVGCSESVDYIPGSDTTQCRSGTRTCQGGQWGACVGTKRSFQSVPAAVLKGATPTPCTANPCDPGCQVFIDTGGDLDGGTGFTTNEAGGISLSQQEAGAVGNWEGGAATCTGLQCQIQPCLSSGGYTATKITGAVYDPAGNNPIPNVLVFIPNGAASVPTDGVSCNTCQAATGSPIVQAVTDFDGTFTLTGVPSGTNIPLVIQSGKWQRQLTLSTVTACTTNNFTTTNGADGRKLIRFPKNRSEGHIPRIAFMSGSADPFECVLLKMGIDANGTGEFSKPTDASGNLTPQRIHWYNSNQNSGYDLASGSGGPGVSVTNLIDSPTRLAAYDAVIFSCEGGQYGRTAAEYQNVVNYAAAGGRIFATHYSYVWPQYAPAASNWPNTVQYWNHASFPSSPLSVNIDRSFPKGDNFAKWLNFVGASPTIGKLTISEARHDYDYVNTANATRWMYNWSNGATGTADPPGAGNSCGSGCGAGLTCLVSGWCPDNTTCATNSDCGATATTGCTWNSDCNGANTYCVSGQCKLRQQVLGVCDGGWCPNNTACTTNSDCGATATTSCTKSSNCKGPNTYCVSKKCSVRRYVTGVCDAGASSCEAKPCTVAADCGGGQTCTGGKCQVDHDMEPLMTYNVPVGAPPASQCGRVVFSDFHVSAGALSGSGSFPASCKSGALSSQEKALEYMLFDLTSCLSPDYIPPGGTGGPPYSVPMAVTRDYTGTCPVGYNPVWHFFDFATHTPGDSSIEFYAQTGPSLASLSPTAPGVLLAKVSGATVPPYTGVDVATKLATAGVSSGAVLRVTFALLPSSDKTLTPTLDSWRQAYDCVAVE